MLRQDDKPLARTAGGQHGFATTEQLRAFGLTTSAIAQRIAAGRLLPKYRGVHAVGHMPRHRDAEWAAALLACGPTAVLSHFAAAAVHGFYRGIDFPIHITVTRHRTGHRGIVLHRTTSLEGQVMRRRGFPVTNPYRTLLDLSDVLDGPTLHTVAGEAEFHGHVDLSKLRRLPGRGSAALAYLFDRIEEGSRSRLEALFLAMCAESGVPRPLVNEKVGRYKADFVWPDLRLIVETDGYDAHRGRAAFEQDRRRIAHFWSKGYDVLPTTWNQVRHEPALVLAALRPRFVT